MKFQYRVTPLAGGGAEILKVAVWRADDPKAPVDEVCAMRLSREEVKELVRLLIQASC